jgi:hypothetical protein
MTLYEMTKSRVKDDSGKLSDPFDYDGAVTEALKRYGKHRPRLMVADLVGNGTHDLVLPTDWVSDYSAITQVEYPVGLVPAIVIDSDLWQLYRSPSGLKLRLMNAAPDATETVRCEYSILYDESTLPVADQDAVANLAASFSLRQLAAAYGQTGDSTIQADSVNYRSKTDEFRRLADSFEVLYKTHLGLKDGDTVPAATITARAPETKRVRLTHGRV